MITRGSLSNRFEALTARESNRVVGSQRNLRARHVLKCVLLSGLLTLDAMIPIGCSKQVQQPSIATADDGSRLRVLVDVFEQDVALVQKGAKVEVRVPAYPDRVFMGVVSQVGDTVEPETRAIHVRIAMMNSERLLKPEVFARVTLHSPAVTAVRVPVGAVLTKADKTYVFVEDRPQHVVARRVVVGARQDTNLQILSGLTRGERVVTKGSLLLDAEMTQRL